MRRLAPVIALLMIAPLLAGCLTEAPAGTREANGPVVYASFYPTQFLAERLLGENATVKALVPAGAEPHAFEPGPRDIAAVTKADAFVYLGLGMEPWLGGFVQNFGSANVALIEATRGLDLEEAAHHDEEHDDPHEGHEEHEGEHVDHEEHDDAHAHEDHHDDAHEDAHHTDVAGNETGHDDHDDHVNATHEDEHVDNTTHEDHHDDAHNETDDASHEEDEHGHDHGGIDPHVWLDPVLWADVARITADQLIEAFPEEAATIRANLANLTADLDALDVSFAEGLADCERDTILVSHNAYGYLAERYDFHVASLSGLTPGGEPSTRHVQRLVDFARDHGITIVFAEPLVAAPTLEVVADEIDGEVRVLYPLGGLTSAQRAEGLDYFDLQERNLQELQVALGCA